MSDKEFELFEQYKNELTPDEQLHKLIHDEEFQEKELTYRRKLIDEFNKIPCQSFTFTKEQLQSLSKSVGTVSISDSDKICREVRGNEYIKMEILRGESNG